MNYEIFFWICIMMLFKSLTVGCDFSLYQLIKHKNKYTEWYFHRETFMQFLNTDNDQN